MLSTDGRSAPAVICVRALASDLQSSCNTLIKLRISFSCWSCSVRCKTKTQLSGWPVIQSTLISDRALLCWPWILTCFGHTWLVMRSHMAVLPWVFVFVSRQICYPHTHTVLLSTVAHTPTCGSIIMTGVDLILSAMLAKCSVLRLSSAAALRGHRQASINTLPPPLHGLTTG